MCGCLLRAPYWGPGLQPRHVPSLGIKLETFQFVGSTQFTEPHQPGLEVSLKVKQAGLYRFQKEFGPVFWSFFLLVCLLVLIKLLNFGIILDTQKS